MGGRVKAFARRALIHVFVDSILVHRLWVCHRLPERSFYVSGRQFHLCARCTGLLVGLALSLCLVPLRESILPAWTVSSIALALDGLTQSFGWRTSNNLLRFTTGLATAATSIPALLALGHV
jgi:uncharacterized membrane protein